MSHFALSGRNFVPLFYGFPEVFHETPVKSPYEFGPANLYLAHSPPPELGPLRAGVTAVAAGGWPCCQVSHFAVKSTS